MFIQVLMELIYSSRNKWKRTKRCNIQEIIKFDKSIKIKLLKFIKAFSLSKISDIEFNQIDNLITKEYIKL